MGIMNHEFMREMLRKNINILRLKVRMTKENMIFSMIHGLKIPSMGMIRKLAIQVGTGLCVKWYNAEILGQWPRRRFFMVAAMAMCSGPSSVEKKGAVQTMRRLSAINNLNHNLYDVERSKVLNLLSKP